MTSIKMRRGRSFAVAGFLLAILSGIGIKQAGAEVHEYSDARFTKEGNAYFVVGGTEGLWASLTGKNISGIANGKSFIKFDPSLKVTRTHESASKVTNETAKVMVEAIIFELADKDNFGYSPSHVARSQEQLCCTTLTAESIGCQPGEVIFSRDSQNPEWPQSRRAYFTGKELTAQFPTETIPITKKGLYSVYFVFCDPELQGLALSGKTIWKNPGGYLDGKMTLLYPCIGLLSLAYFALGLVWLVQCVRYWKEILKLQHCITAALALRMCEITSWYFYYAHINATGKRASGLLLWAATCRAAGHTVFRFLIVVVSMGYGVVPNRTGVTSLLIHTMGAAMGATYFVADKALIIFEKVVNLTSTDSRIAWTLSRIVGYLDILFFFWTFISLYMTLGKLRTRKHYATLKQYRRFTWTLVLAFVIGLWWEFYLFDLWWTDRFDERWESAWIISAFWDLFTFALLIVVCLLWAPSQNSTRIAYEKDFGEDHHDEEVVALTTSGAVAENEKNFIEADHENPVHTGDGEQRGGH